MGTIGYILGGFAFGVGFVVIAFELDEWIAKREAARWKKRFK